MQIPDLILDLSQLGVKIFQDGAKESTRNSARAVILLLWSCWCVKNGRNQKSLVFFSGLRPKNVERIESRGEWKIGIATAEEWRTRCSSDDKDWYESILVIIFIIGLYLGFDCRHQFHFVIGIWKDMRNLSFDKEKKSWNRTNRCRLTQSVEREDQKNVEARPHLVANWKQLKLWIILPLRWTQQRVPNLCPEKIKWVIF